MSDTVWIVLIVAVAVVVVLFIFRRQLKDFVFKVNKDELNARLSTHPPTEGNTSSPGSSASGAGVRITGNRMWGQLQRIFVSRPDVEVSKNTMVGRDQQIEVTAETQRVAHLHQQITLNLSVNDFRVLCVDLGQNYDALPGPDLPAKTHALLAALQRQQRLPELVAAGRRLRPNLPWEIE